MSRVRYFFLCAVALCISSLPRAASAAGDPSQKTLSPYFVVENGDPSVDGLPLTATKVDVAIAGVIADVTVTQSYENRGKRPIHARYVFPASTRAAVHGMRMTLVGAALATNAMRARREAVAR
jgi:Ca-activated chloride channel family protein